MPYQSGSNLILFGLGQQKSKLLLSSCRYCLLSIELCALDLVFFDLLLFHHVVHRLFREDQGASRHGEMR